MMRAMRFWELALIAVNFGLLGWALFANGQTGRRPLLPLAAAYGLVIVQLIADGARWQMIPAYLTPVILTVCLVFKKRQMKGRNRLMATLQAALLVVLFTVAAALPALMPVFSFAKPTGPYAVGTTLYDWADEKRGEDYTEDPSDHRELMVQIWYPAEQDRKIKPAPYIANVPAVTQGLDKALSIPAFALSHLRLVNANAEPEAKLSDSEGHYPVLLFSHGLTGFRNQNMFEVEELASRGYIVVGIDHAYDAAATTYLDGRIAPIKFANLSGFADLDGHMKLWTDDVSFVLDQLEALNRSPAAGRFTGRIDIGRIGMLGHSYGGAAAAQMLMKDARIKAGIDMDGTLYGTPASAQGLGKPFLLMNAEKSIDKSVYDQAVQQAGTPPDESKAFWDETVRRRVNALAGGGFSMVIPHTDHMSYTDFHLFSPLLPPKGEDPRRVHRIINEFTTAFADQYVKQAGDGSALRALAAKYPEVNFRVN
jgi:predicted dienelactone hydrolase